mmetsp:Transcript_25718/g.61252  ORF Transcript_25718/g.61252 Transcript_25718/m.61252 type:complete len:231 (+) Transcript_25718:1714-2406(+)
MRRRPRAGGLPLPRRGAGGGRLGGGAPLERPRRRVPPRRRGGGEGARGVPRGRLGQRQARRGQVALHPLRRRRGSHPAARGGKRGAAPRSLLLAGEPPRAGHGAGAASADHKRLREPPRLLPGRADRLTPVGDAERLPVGASGRGLGHAPRPDQLGHRRPRGGRGGEPAVGAGADAGRGVAAHRRLPGGRAGFLHDPQDPFHRGARPCIRQGRRLGRRCQLCGAAQPPGR